MITLTGYWKDRESRYRMECTGEIRANAAKTVDAWNKLLQMFFESTGIILDMVTSGWRPKSINDATANAAKGSNHLLALAGDVADPDRALAQWCVSNPDKLVECGIWIEDPRWCAKWNEKTQQWDFWVHGQIVPPKSGKRIYIPSLKPPTAPALVGQNDVPVRLKI